MAAAPCQVPVVRALHSHRAAGEDRPVRATAAAVSFGGLACSRGETWRTSGVRLVASAVAEEAVAASQAESAAESLSMYFKAEGSLSENAVTKVTKVLEGTEGVSKVKVCVDEGAATVELVKQTDIQATGVASSLVEIIEQAGFKMQALSLGFDDDDAEDDEYIDYDSSTYAKDEEEATAE